MASQASLKDCLVFSSILLSRVSSLIFSSKNIAVDIGTRRPLIIQMINDPGILFTSEVVIIYSLAEKEHPSCRFRKEFPMADTDPFEDKDTPVHSLTDEIIRRTNERAGPVSSWGTLNVLSKIPGVGPDKVSAVPIILRVQYCHCANLTIYDTPVKLFFVYCCLF